MSIPLELQEKIDKLVARPIKISEVNNTRREQLEEIERIFNNRCQYVSKIKAAESMGMSKHRIYKSLNDLYRIRIEENYSKMDDSFRDSLKVDIQPQVYEIKENLEQSQVQKEGDEK